MKMLDIGAQYGRFLVIGPAYRDGRGVVRQRCRCDCGHEADFSVDLTLKKPNRHCRNCAPHTGGRPKPDIVGKHIQGWEVLSEAGYVNGVWMFNCRCERCGAESMKSAGELHTSRSARCAKCPPMYGFEISGNTAIGTLPDGSQFIIDKDTIPIADRYYWRRDTADGYVRAYKPHNIALHRLIVGVDDPKVIVDHINRNRLDCRRENLRVISAFGNSCNHGSFITNKSGHIGVYYSKCSGKYEVKVGYNRRRILLGSSQDDLVTLAQMYNIGAKFFFGDFVGELNDVPDPSPELVARVEAKCKRYLGASA